MPLLPLANVSMVSGLWRLPLLLDGNEHSRALYGSDERQKGTEESILKVTKPRWCEGEPTDPNALYI